MRKVVVAVCATIALVVPVQALTLTSYISGGDYQELPRSERIIYVKGLHDMMVRMCVEVNALSSTSDAAAFCRRVASCTKDMNGNQLTDFIDSFVAERADAKGAAMSSVYRAAMNIKCPSGLTS